MKVIDKFFSLLAFCASINRLVAPPIAVSLLYFSGTETNSLVLGFIFAVIALAPYVIVTTGVVVAMRYFEFIDWVWMDTLVPASSLLVIPTIWLIFWLVTHLRMEIKLQDDQSP